MVLFPAVVTTQSAAYTHSCMFGTRPCSVSHAAFTPRGETRGPLTTWSDGQLFPSHSLPTASTVLLSRKEPCSEPPPQASTVGPLNPASSRISCRWRFVALTTGPARTEFGGRGSANSSALSGITTLSQRQSTSHIPLFSRASSRFLNPFSAKCAP